MAERFFARPNHGTVVGPCHACDYVDIFMDELDRELVSRCPVPLLILWSRAPPWCKEELIYLDWSRFRDDGITILPNAEYVSAFEHLQNLHPPDIKWVVIHGKEAEYLDVKLHIVNGLIETSAKPVTTIFFHIVAMPHLSSRGSFQEWVRGCACFAPMINLSRKD